MDETPCPVPANAAIESRELTDKFYLDYKQLRTDLFEALRQHNAERKSTELLAASTEQLREIRETGESVLQMAARINQVSSQAQQTAPAAGGQPPAAQQAPYGGSAGGPPPTSPWPGSASANGSKVPPMPKSLM